MDMKVMVCLLGIMLLAAGCYWLAGDGSNLIRSGENADVEPEKGGDYAEVQKENYAAILLVKTGDQEGKFDDQWRYIFSDPMYILLVIIAVFLNVVLLRKLIKEEL
ncbi:MAG: hypothetical protein AAF992_06270 [Bacteroidota bacterium]